MKFLAFLFSTGLLAMQLHAQPTSTAKVGPPPSWGGVIDKYAKEGVPEPTDNIDAKLATEAYSEQERAARSAKTAKAGATPPPAKSAPAAALAGTADAQPKPGQEDDLSKSIKGAVKDLVNPFKEVLIDQSAEKKQDGDPLARLGPEGQTQQASGSSTAALQPRTDDERKRMQMHHDHMIEELVEELKPWAVGAVVVAFLGFCVNLWIAYAKRKTQRASARASSGSGSSASRSGTPSGFAPSNLPSHLQTDNGRSSSRKSRNRSRD